MSSPDASKTCLLVIPRHFYSFEKMIRETLESKAYKVVVCNDEYPSGNFGKIMGKLHIPLLLPITEHVICRDYLNNKKYDLILIFKGRGISKSLIQKMVNSATRVIGYNWDSFKYNKAPLRWYQYATKYYTFDYRDAEKYSLPIVELFSSINTHNTEKEIEYDISAIIRNHSGRLKYLDDILNILDKEKIYTYIYEQNFFFFLMNFFRNPFLYIKYKNRISFKPLGYSDYVDIMRKSNFTIDYAHPYQSGITMRCFEAISVNTKIITNNVFLTKSRYFKDANPIICVENKVNSRELNEAYASCQNTPSTPMTRTISDFIDELIA
jgi:hypothetical protein